MTVNRVTKLTAEVIAKQEAAARITQLSGEVIASGDPDLRVSQLVGEVVYTTSPQNRVTFISLEVIAKLATAKIMQVGVEVITNINPISTDNLKLCLPFDQTLGESYTEDGSISNHPIDLTTELVTIESSPSKFGGGAVDLNGNDWIRALLPQPDFNFTGDFTIEFWIFKNVGGALEDIMGQWPSTANKSWRIRFNGTSLQFEWTPDGSTVNTESVIFDVPTSTWTHLAFENFSGVFTFYVNGLAVYNAASFVPIFASTSDLYIGKVESSTGGNEFDGSIDELKITVGSATFQAPFPQPIISIDCQTIILDISWDPGNVGQQVECSDSQFVIVVNGIETIQGTQEFQATGLPPGMSIDAFGNIIGTLPTHDAPPNIKRYEFTVTFYNNGIPLLGPDTWSFDVENIFDQDILQVTVPSLFEGEDRTLWKTHLLGLIPFLDIFRVTDPNFGIRRNPDLFIINGLTEDSLINWQNAVIREDGKGPEKYEVTFKTLKIAEENPDFDVLYYSIEDPGSTILTFPNPLNVARQLTVSPDPIEPISIDNIRDLLIAAIGFDILFGIEVVPSWLDTFEPLIVAAFVTKGKGQAILDKFNNDAVHHTFKGKVIKIDRLNIRRCSTLWDENNEAEIIIKFDDL